MPSQIQQTYVKRLKRYQSIMYGVDEHGVLAKYVMYESLSKRLDDESEALLKYDPLLYHVRRSLELDLHLSISKLIEARSHRNLFQFIDFCLSNRRHIYWADGSPPEEKLFAQKQSLESHRAAINNIKARRDKFYAHLDAKYFDDPDAIFIDFPISKKEFTSLFGCIECILQEHQHGLEPDVAVGTTAGWFAILVENMMRRLESGRKATF